jgi:hypothetical protein
VAIVLPSGHGKDMTTPLRPHRWKTNEVLHCDFTPSLECVEAHKPKVIIIRKCGRLPVSTVFVRGQHLFA